MTYGRCLGIYANRMIFNELMSNLLLDIDCLHGASPGVGGVAVKSHHAAATPMGYPAFRSQLFPAPQRHLILK